MYNVGTPSDTHSVEEGKPDHRLEYVKRQLISHSPRYLHVFDVSEDSMIDYFREFIHTNVEYAELESKVRYRHDIFEMYRDTIQNCQSYSEVKKFCNLFLKVISMHRHHGECLFHSGALGVGDLRSVAHELKWEWEEVLGGEPLVDIN